MQRLELKNVNKVFGSGTNRVQALSQVNFEAKAGELTLILGPSGSGKSTLLTILGGLQQPTSGEVLINGNRFDGKRGKAADDFRLKHIGFVLQSYSLVPYLTVAEQFQLVDKVKKAGNLPPKQFDNDLNRLGITSLLDKYPGELSGGQSQRVAIARALYANPDFILADEPTAALDSARVQEVGRLLKDIAEKEEKAVVVVTHDLRLKEEADRIYQLVDGKISLEKS
ncbi:ABC transporter ATP-binding protein [Fructobacillus fructosus]|jgi:putative ABC transport system ATP-binding protein|uniref:Putative hemin import ATP-binding protein HrtA n=1 Tax=Fructobacillus fructosus TaxID=1631 RepID=A0ABN9YXQ3_9LACO|nr:ABC transporter ATP-binding protein [Fructobacillus fructosus]MBD9366131.1 ABC transporter ATP-binding protein [Leuconostoc mesenteroides]KRN52654.1 ABC transporter ATP-binding protein [Fructobacillus fructosus KCTC 3544]MBC9119057.1 ABC transporter ATP-binding protein [Fructobacillus fructosus]MCK8638619.1 ABC transporter ATP-binding protein [Fructobacillus fructosus]CAK1242925.1 ABC-type lipoprotein export system [Fructobacillus fructosus]